MFHKYTRDWYASQQFVQICTGGGMQNLWSLKNTPHWCGVNDKQYYHPGRGGPRNWYVLEPEGEYWVREQESQIAKLQETIAQLQQTVAELSDKANKDEETPAKRLRTG